MPTGTPGEGSPAPWASGAGAAAFDGALRGGECALRSGRLGTAGLLLTVLAATAPLMVVAGVMPAAFGVLGVVGQPLLFVLVGAVLVLFSFGYAELSRHVHNAGAFYACILPRPRGHRRVRRGFWSPSSPTVRSRQASTGSSATRSGGCSAPTSTSASPGGCRRSRRWAWWGCWAG